MVFLDVVTIDEEEDRPASVDKTRDDFEIIKIVVFLERALQIIRDQPSLNLQRTLHVF